MLYSARKHWMKKTKKKLTAWRLSPAAREVLQHVSTKTGKDMTEVVEFAIAQYARKFPELIEEANQVLIRLLRSKTKEDNLEE